MTIRPPILLLATLLACDSGDAKGKADAKTKTDAKTDAKAKADAKAKFDAPPETPAQPKPSPDAKADSKADAKADSKAEPAPTPATPTPAAPARPADVPADWQPVVGDAWSFWVPASWKVEDFAPGDGGTGDKGDKIADAARVEAGMAISSLSCRVRSDLPLPTKLADLELAMIDRAKKDAKKHEVKAAIVKVDHDGTEREAVHLEYKAIGDGTLVFERWTLSSRPLGIVCTDESKSGGDDPKILATALASFRWAAPSE
jgi:hypothetical protein